MIQVRKSKDRAFLDHGWLKTYHTFSFGEYYDPDWMGFRVLRVINEDFVAPAMGFGTHGHRDMEIVTYIIDGELEHKDSMGNGSVIKPGEIQYMSAGKGVTHSEFNPSQTQSTHLLQIWILPNAKGLTPQYDQKSYGKLMDQNWRSLLSENSKDSLVHIRQDVHLYTAQIAQGEQLEKEIAKGRYGWLQVVKGKLKLGDQEIEAGDGAALVEEPRVSLKALSDKVEVLFFDLP